MSDLLTTNDLFFNKTGLDQGRVTDIVNDTLLGAEDGELFLEHTQSESITWDDQKLKKASFDTEQGFGLRSILGEASGFAHSSELSEAAIKRAASTVKAVHHGHDGKMALAPLGTNINLYTDENPINALPFDQKLRLMETLDQYARGKDARVKQVSISLSGSWRAMQIIRSDCNPIADIRPLVTLHVSVVMEKDGRMESGSYGCGGRFSYEQILKEENWQHAVNEAIRKADTNMQSIPCKAGEMPVVLGPGWPGVLLHEAFGHGLEGDFNRKKTSVFSNMMGERVAAPGVTVIDDGTIPDRRGSLAVDDEGTPSKRNVLVEDGILVGYLQDRMNARLMNTESTGSGRRESYAHNVMPRMSNTFMENGHHDPQEIIESVKDGIYATDFGGGQVDITSGKFVFSASAAFKIENGKITTPVKGVTFVGTGSDSMQKISMIGNDLALDNGIGTCGKDGQSVPVGVGQPTVKISSMTVGGTE